MSGSVSLSWGSYAGWFVYRAKQGGGRIMLGWVALTWWPSEIDDYIRSRRGEQA